MSADCPKNPDALVGPQCPCNHFKKLKPEQWYYSPASEEFKTDPRRPPVGEKQFAYFHKLGKCRRMREEAHKLARGDTKYLNLLNPLERGATDCMAA